MEHNVDDLKWQKLVAPYTQPSLGRSIWQLVNTMVPYFAVWGLMIWTIQISYWITLGLSILAAGLMVRLFILFHDCCHGSFFKSRQANETLGSILGIFVFTPFHHWRHSHNIHHASASNLDKRGIGDVWTMTVQEYLAAPWWKRAAYRTMRNPYFLFSIGASYVFFIAHRFWASYDGKVEKLSVVYTNLGMAAFYGMLMFFFGWQQVLMVQIPITIFASAIGVWMFYVQHQFEDTYWSPKPEWSFVRAGMEGSSFYKLPPVFQWFSGNIGFHHIHHLSPKIPNYYLPKCHEENPAFQVEPLTFWESLKCTTLHLYDDTAKRLITWKELQQIRLSMNNMSK